MQQYMIQIINNLEKRGYRRLNPDSNNVYGRTDGGDAVYVVVIGSNRDLGAEQLKRFNDTMYGSLRRTTANYIYLKISLQILMAYMRLLISRL